MPEKKRRKPAYKSATNEGYSRSNKKQQLSRGTHGTSVGFNQDTKEQLERRSSRRGGAMERGRKVNKLRRKATNPSMKDFADERFGGNQQRADNMKQRIRDRDAQKKYGPKY